jgi:hypothetical protein
LASKPPSRPPAGLWAGSPSKSQSRRETYHGCHGGPDDYFAVWKNVGQTTYTVRKHWKRRCTPDTTGPNYILWSPNAGDRRSSFYCVYGRKYVRNIGDRWRDERAHIPGALD